MAKIGIIGYGKMGKTIERIAKERGNQIEFIADEKPEESMLHLADVCIEFSMPEAAYENLKLCIENKVPVVCGTTGWLDKMDEIKALTKEKQGSFLYASNFSLGVNIFFEVNRRLAQLLGPFNQYTVSMEETHHIHKIDKPSGTAISTAKDIIEETRWTGWDLDKKMDDNHFVIKSNRKGEIPGTHTVIYDSEVDRIKLEHEAKSRDGFALGAVLAAEWIVGKQGIFTMKDVLNI